MKIVCQKSELLNGVNIALKAIPAKTTMPILECIVIEASEAGIKLTANDMELGIETIVKGDIADNGVIAINAKIFAEIIRKLPDSDITLESDDNFQMTIRCEKSVFQIAGKSSDEFPSLPEIMKKDALVISQFTLKELINQTVFSISENESNKIMTGELFEIKNNVLRVVALDGHRIAIRKVGLKNEFEDKKVIVPGKALKEISKILSGETEKEVFIYFTDRHILFEFDETLVLSRLIDGEYYKIDQMITSDYDTKIVVNKKEFLSCIDRATLLIKETEKKPIIINSIGEGFEMKVNTSLGSMNEDLEVIKEGKDITIGFNPKFLIEALRAIDDEEAFLFMTNPKAPCFIRDTEDNYIYLILPVNISAN